MGFYHYFITLVHILAVWHCQVWAHMHIKFTGSDSKELSPGITQELPEAEETHRISGRKRRDTSQTCSDLPGKPTRHWAALTGDKNFNLALVWVGKDSPTQLLLTTLQFGVILTIRAPSKLYRRRENEKNFRLIQNEIQNGDIRKNFGIMKSPINANKVLLISFSYSFSPKPTTIYRSADGASSFEAVSLPFQVRANEPLQFHATKEDWILALDSDRQSKYSAWLSTDFGKTWKKLKSLVESVKWGTNTEGEKDDDAIYLMTRPTLSVFGPPLKGTLWRSVNLGESFEKLVDDVHNFGLQGKFVFVSLDNGNNKRTVHVSSNGGLKFNPINVPEVESERFFSILDMSEGSILLHVDERGDTGYGTLYISDGDGLKYTKSLEHHFYTNDGVTDFYKVESMRGVFITHQLNTDDQTIQSLISFNRGVTWQPLYLSPEQCQAEGIKPGQKCSLHFHNIYSQVKGVNVQGPLSTDTALGLIMLHGHHGDALTGRTDVYLSNNGGYNWQKVLKGAHHYAIGDHGNLIVAVSKLNESGNELLYSLDRGNCWKTLLFSDDKLIVRGLITEPGSKTRTFSLWGYESEKHMTSKEWVVVTVDFHNVFRSVCMANDMETWYPHKNGDNDGCLLGVKETYEKAKPGSYCFHGRNYKPKVEIKRCQCKDDDFECEYGFNKKGPKCYRDPKIELKVCQNGKEIQVTDDDGYRLIPGDRCEGWENKVHNFVNKGCPTEGTQPDRREEEEPNKSSTVTHEKEVKHNVALYVAIPVLLILLVVLAYFGRKQYLLKNQKASFRYSDLNSMLSDDEEDHKVLYDPRPKGLRPYRDESGAESDTQMLDL